VQEGDLALYPINGQGGQKKEGDRREKPTLSWKVSHFLSVKINASIDERTKFVQEKVTSPVQSLAAPFLLVGIFAFFSSTFSTLHQRLRLQGGISGRGKKYALRFR